MRLWEALGAHWKGKLFIVHKHHVHLVYLLQGGLFHSLLVLEELVFQWREFFGSWGWEFSSWVIPGLSVVSLLPLSLWVVVFLILKCWSWLWGIHFLGGWLWPLLHLPGKAGGGIYPWEKQNFLSCVGSLSPAEEVLQSQAALLLVLGSLQPPNS